MYTLLYFSPTGNARYLSKKLVKHLGEESTKIYPLEFLDSKTLKKDDHLILVYPIHGFNAPRTVKRFVKSLPEGLYDSVSLIAVGCNTIWVNDAVSIDLKKKLIKKGYEIVVDEILAMPLTFIMSFPEETKTKLIEVAEKSLIGISKSIKENIKSEKKVKFKSKLINFIGKAESPAARMFGLELHAKKGCTSCGICWNNCPEYNIKKNKKGFPRFGFKCSMCMRCIYNCPEKVITPRISKFIPIKNGYKLKD